LARLDSKLLAGPSGGSVHCATSGKNPIPVVKNSGRMIHSAPSSAALSASRSQAARFASTSPITVLSWIAAARIPLTSSSCFGLGRSVLCFGACLLLCRNVIRFFHGHAGFVQRRRD